MTNYIYIYFTSRVNIHEIR